MNIITTFQISETILGALFFMIFFSIYRISMNINLTITDLFYTSFSVGFIIWIGKVSATYITNNY
jgi:hypothetical protein